MTAAPNPFLAALGLPPDARVLVLHLDDVGSSLASNIAWEALHRAGALSSAAVMMPCPWAPDALMRHRRMEGVDLGVHLTLTCEWDVYRWGPYGPGPRSPLIDREGFLPKTAAELERITSGAAGLAAVESEMCGQIAGALAAGVDVTHIDAHMFAAFQPAYAETYVSLAREYGVPAMMPGTEAAWADWCSPAEARQAAEAVRPLREAGLPLFDKLLEISRELPADQLRRAEECVRGCVPGLNYLFFHACADTPELRAYAADWPCRVGDFAAVSDGRLREVIREEGVVLLGMREIRDAMRSAGV